MSQQVLHLDFVSLSPTTGQQDRQQLIDAAAGLAALGQVHTLGVIEATSDSDFDLAFFFVLHDFASLEPFGTDPRYSRFLQGEVAPRLKAFAGADVRLDDDFAATGVSAACIALMAPDETYDWEVREALQTWTFDTGGTDSLVGLAVGERQQYRGLAIAFGETLAASERPDPERYRSTLVTGNARMLA